MKDMDSNRTTVECRDAALVSLLVRLCIGLGRRLMYRQTDCAARNKFRRANESVARKAAKISCRRQGIIC